MNEYESTSYLTKPYPRAADVAVVPPLRGPKTCRYWGGLASGLSQWGTSTGREMPRSYSGREKRSPSDYGVGGALGELAAEDQQLGFGRVEDTICISLYQ